MAVSNWTTLPAVTAVSSAERRATTLPFGIGGSTPPVPTVGQLWPR